MLLRRKSSFASVRTEGGLLPPDLLVRIANGDSKLAATAASDYHLGDGETKREAISRSWSRLASAWTAFQDALAKLPPNDPATTTTREKWLGLVFQELGFGRLEKRTAVDIEGKSYAISHGWRSVPIHLVGANVPIDRRSEHVVGASRTSPHGLVQEFLNRRDDALWGIVSNGKTMRLLRDSVRLSRPAYIEFDLAAIFEGGAFADFALFWLVCHQSRFEPFQSERIEDCVLERWSKAADEEGTRVLDGLRDGVRAAIEDLGRGFLAHPSNTRLRDALRDGRLAPQAYYRQLLRAAYRLIFQAVAEDRGILLDPNADAAARERYTAWYSLARVRRLAEKRRGSRHDDLWCMVKVVWRLLGDDRGGPALALHALGSFLWSDAAVPDLIGAELTNAAFLDAIHHLAFAIDGNTRRAVDFEHLGAEELGSVYESLLELHPELHLDDARFDLNEAAGNDRKSTGSYYTPDSLVQCLLDSALEPVLEAIVSADDRRSLVDRLLAVKVCDPACGSGHFLIAAAHRIAKRVAQARTGDDEPAPADHRQALRDVIGRCLFGVDKNEMAVELCKVSLWLESLTSGQPLSFLDDRILVGDALLGATPALLRQPLPPEAFDAIGDDDKALARHLKSKNKNETKVGQGQLNFALGSAGGVGYADLTREARGLDAFDDRAIAGIRAKEAGYRRLHDSPEYRRARLAADAWCAAFVWPKKKTEPEGLTTGNIRGLVRGEAVLSAEQARTVERLRRQYAFFHWYVEFPQVFEVEDGGADASAAGWVGGFDCVLGNPPWERVKLQEQEFFASRSRAIAEAPNAAARRKLIEDLPRGGDGLIEAYEDTLRAADGASHLVRNSGRYPLCGRGDVNTYSIFAETMRTIVSARGRIGCIVPSGIATDDTTKFFFQDLMETGSLVSLFDFENSVGLFPGVGHGRAKFTLLTLQSATGQPSAPKFAFFAQHVSDLRDPNRVFELSASDIKLMNPNTQTCPVLRTRRDAEITKAIYRRVPVLIEEGPPEKNPWGLTFAAMFHMSIDSGLFKTKSELEGDGWKLDGNVFTKGGDRYLPLYEAKMIHHFNHRWGDYALRAPGSRDTELPDVPIESLKNQQYIVMPRYWVPKPEVDARLAGRWDREWLIGWRDICRSTDERTVIASVVPRVGCGDTLLIMLPTVEPELAAFALPTCLNSFVADYAARQKIGGTHLKFHVFKQLCVLPPTTYKASSPWDPAVSVGDWVRNRAVELLYTAEDLEPLAQSVGYDGPPFEWNEERRFQLRCELDAAFFHLYGIARDDVDYILETFPIVKRNDEKRWGEYRTKRVILELFDAMAGAVPDKAEAQAGDRAFGEPRRRPAKQSEDPAS
jgi:hypothetical protein